MFFDYKSKKLLVLEFAFPKLSVSARSQVGAVSQRRPL